MGNATIYDQFMQPGQWEDIDDLDQTLDASVDTHMMSCIVINVLWRAVLWALVCLLAVKLFGNLHATLLLRAVEMDYGLI